MGLTKNDGTLGGNKQPALVSFDLQTNTTTSTGGAVGVLSRLHFLPFPLGGLVCRGGGAMLTPGCSQKGLLPYITRKLKLNVYH